jgi:amidase
VDSEVHDVLSAAVAFLASNGWQVREAAPCLAAADEVFRVMRALYLAARFGELLRDHRDEIKETLAANIELGLRLTGDEVTSAYRQRAVIFSRLQDLLSSHDVLALPTAQVAPFSADREWVSSIAGVPQATYIDWLRSCSRVTVTGHPAVSVPAGFTADGLPVGLQLIGRLGSDYRLLDVAAEIEEVIGATSRVPRLHQPPEVLDDLARTASPREAPP